VTISFASVPSSSMFTFIFIHACMKALVCLLHNLLPFAFMAHDINMASSGEFSGCILLLELLSADPLALIVPT